MLISVIIPAYNRASIIDRAIDSVLNQSWKELELIVVDDASTDCLEEVISEYTDKRLKYIRIDENQGACHARNVGILASVGEYIAFQDSDDYWYPQKLEKQMGSLLRSEKDLSVCRMVSEYVNTGRMKEFHKISFSKDELNLMNELANSFISTQLLIGRKDCFKEIMFDETFPRFQDWDLGIRLVERFQFDFVDEVLVKRFVDSDSLSTNPEKGFQAGQMLFDKHLQLYNQYPKSQAKFLEFYSQLQELNGISSFDNLLTSIKLDFRVKTLVKLLMQITGVYRAYLMKRK